MKRFKDAREEENVEALQTIVLDIGDRVDLKPPEENMQTIALFDTEKDLDKFLNTRSALQLKMMN